MSVTGPSANITAIERLSERELQQGIIGEASWHHRYKDSSYIYIGGLDKRMTEGDVVIVFSQFGDPVDIHLKRDSKTGASLGYGFLAYRDQRSTILAVDNFNGYSLLGRRLRVDHVLDYKAPVEYEDEVDDEGNKIRKEYKPTGAEGQGIDKYYVTSSEAILKEAYRSRPPPKKDPKDTMDEEERWAMDFEASLRTADNKTPEKPELARRSSSRSHRRRKDASRERHRHREGRHRRRSRSRSSGRRHRRSSSSDTRRGHRRSPRKVDRARRRSPGGSR
ncbi:RNA-binding protein, putative [Babesia caballi]|uniref:RNA-binding protein, putative n=1 Tax=Babesia caballi TaxID=5871 RepID=A0AAV4M131_BABCB|nr:RNA-binding protein, putative [Babesia caballi]